MNIFDTIFENNCKHPEKLALSVTMNDGSKRAYNYGEVFEIAEQYGNTLLSSGIKEGDRIAFVCEGSPEWTIAFFAVCKIKCTATLIDASLSGEELKEYINRSDVRAAFLSAKTYEKIGNDHGFMFPILNVYDCSLFDGSCDKVMMEPTSDPDAQIAAIIYSSGTTRRAAGIMHTHDSLINTTKMTLEIQELKEDDRYLAIIPNSHIYGVICLVLGPHISGADVHYIETLSAEAILGAFEEYHPTILSAVPKVYELFMTQIMRKIKSNPVTAMMFKTFFPICLKKRRKNGNMLGAKLFKSIHEGFGGSMRVLCSAGAPMNKDVADFYYGTGFNLLITYGASETNIPTIGNTVQNLTTNTCGKPYPAITLKISDEGELLIKSPFMMKGYFRDEEATREAFDLDGWFKTGDLGYQDEKGNIQITGRLKENIVLSTGKKIAPDDIESKYSALSGVKEFVICGVPAQDSDYDEIHAFVVPEKTGSDGFEGIKKQIVELGSQLVQNMRISKTHFVDEIPRTSLQKPKRYLLKQQAIKEGDGDGAQTTSANAKDTLGRVTDIIAGIANSDASDIKPETKIFSDLAIDSLSAINLALELEDVFKVNIEKYYNEDMTVNDVALALQGKGTQNAAIGQDNLDYPLDKSSIDYNAYRFFKNFAKFCYKIKFEHTENVPEHCGFIICTNHISKIDYLFISAALSRKQYMHLCCMAKKELFRNDMFSRRLIKSAGMVPVDRGGINKKSMDNLKKRLNDNWGVVIHPEGTRSEDGIFREIKSGASALAVSTGVPVIPAYIDGAYEIFPKGKKMIKFFDWKHFKKFPITVTFGTPISSKGVAVEELTEKIQNSILELQGDIKEAVTK